MGFPLSRMCMRTDFFARRDSHQMVAEQLICILARYEMLYSAVRNISNIRMLEE
jgi:hypothetical protein